MREIDLRSDTVTRPGPAMREAMARAEVGDDVYGEDPTVGRLQEVAAERLGKQAALFVPSGTMANQIALRVHTSPGDAAIVGEHAHVDLYESGGAAALSGVQLVVAGSGGLFDAAAMEAAVFPPDAHHPHSALVCVENTHNRSGGRVFPFDDVRAICARAAGLGLARHLDGARLFNAEVASGIPAARLAEGFDTVSFCLSKGLGAPVGSLLAGSRECIVRAHRVRKQLGGGMRQAGILAAGGLYALEHHVERLAEDHASARRLAAGLERIGLKPLAPPETNMVVVEAPDAAGVAARAAERGVRIGVISPGRLRAVTHLDVSGDDVDEAIERLRGVA